METRLEVVNSARLWWPKLGKWEALAAVLTTGAFFVTLSITGDMEDALFVAVAFVAVAFAAVAVAILVMDEVLSSSCRCCE